MPLLIPGLSEETQVVTNRVDAQVSGFATQIRPDPPKAPPSQQIKDEHVLSPSLIQKISEALVEYGETLEKRIEEISADSLEGAQFRKDLPDIQKRLAHPELVKRIALIFSKSSLEERESAEFPELLRQVAPSLRLENNVEDQVMMVAKCLSNRMTGTLQDVAQYVRNLEPKYLDDVMKNWETLRKVSQSLTRSFPEIPIHLIDLNLLRTEGFPYNVIDSPQFGILVRKLTELYPSTHLTASDVIYIASEIRDSSQEQDRSIAAVAIDFQQGLSEKRTQLLRNIIQGQSLDANELLSKPIKSPLFILISLNGMDDDILQYMNDHPEKADSFFNLRDAARQSLTALYGRIHHICDYKNSTFSDLSSFQAFADTLNEKFEISFYQIQAKLAGFKITSEFVKNINWNAPYWDQLKASQKESRSSLLRDIMKNHYPQFEVKED